MKYLTVLAAIVVLFAVEGCEEKPITYNDLNAPFSTDTLVTHSITGYTYMTPPEFGGNKRLYLGRQNGFEIPLTLLAFESVSNSITMSNLLDSAITIDSVHIQLTSSDSAFTSAPFSLYYFPESGESFFTEVGTTYLDGIIEEVENKAVLIGDSSIVQLNDTLNPVLLFDFPVALFTGFIDTSANNTNRTVMIKPASDFDGLATFYSEESSFNPLLAVFYTVADSDSVISKQVSFKPLHDLSVVRPLGDTNANDFNYWTLNSARQLKTIIQINLDSLGLPEQAILTKADLFISVFDSQDSSFNLQLLTLSEAAEDTQSVYDLDPFTSYTSQSTTLNGTVKDGIVVFNMNRIIQSMHMGAIDNFGFKLISKSASPFDIIHFYSPEDTSYDPYLEVVYVSE